MDKVSDLPRKKMTDLLKSQCRTEADNIVIKTTVVAKLSIKWQINMVIFLGETSLGSGIVQ